MKSYFRAVDDCGPMYLPAVRPAIRGRVILMSALLVLALEVAALPWNSGADAAENPAQKATQTASQTLWVYFGTYTNGESKGIYLSQLDLASGALSRPRLVAETVNPSFLAVHPSERFLYAVNEVGDFEGRSSGAVSAFALDPETGGLTFLNQQASRGAGPCHLIVDKSGKDVLVANYGGGSVAVLPIGSDGRLSPASAFSQHQGSSVNPRRQEGPHAHSINLDAANRFAFAADLGLDKVLVYRFEASRGSLSAGDPPSASVKPGSGPRHFAFHPSGRYAYVINEIASTVTAFAYDADRGTLNPIGAVSTLPEGFEGRSSTAEVQVHPSGRFLYGSNRGHDSIVVFALDSETGKLSYVEHEPTGGRTPRGFGIDPTGTYLLAGNQDSDLVVVFRIDPQSGALEPTGHEAKVPMPVCVKFAHVAR